MARVIGEGHLAGVRINGAHVRSPDRLPTVIRFVREAIAASGRENVRVLLDLAGPKIRTRNKESIRLSEPRPGSGEKTKDVDTIILSTKSPETGHQADVPVIPVSYANLIEDVRPGSWIKIDDGQVTLSVDRVDKTAGHIYCRVLRGDQIEPDKGLNLIGASVSAPNLTPNLDLPQLENLISQLATEEWPEFVSLSFVKSVEDIRVYKETFLRLVREHGREPACAPGVIAKIERFELFDCLEDAIQLGDQTGMDLLTFLKDLEVNAVLGDHFPCSLASVQQQAFRYGHVYHEMEHRNLSPPASRLQRLGMDPERVVRGLYALREILRIMDEVDAVMYARGDLSVEIDPRRTAVLRDFFQMCARRSGVADIIATDILPALRHGTRITAAEGEALANLGRVRPSAIMASNEIAVGRDPVFVAREIYDSVVYLLGQLFGQDPVQLLARSYAQRNTAVRPDALAGPIHEGVRSAIEMLSRQPGQVSRGLEGRAGMLEEIPGKIFVILQDVKRNTPFSRTPGERLVRLVASERPGAPIIPVRIGDEHRIPSFLDWGVHAPITLPGSAKSDVDRPTNLLSQLAHIGAAAPGERCCILWISDKENVQVFCGEVP
jgi:pyruvate kinase